MVLNMKMPGVVLKANNNMIKRVCIGLFIGLEYVDLSGNQFTENWELGYEC